MIRNTLAILLLIAGHALADTITLRDSDVPAGDGVVTLGNIAELEGERAESLADVVVADATGPTTPISLTAVREQLTEAGAHWGKITLRGPSQIIVNHRGTRSPVVDAPQKSAAPALAGETATATANPIAMIDLGQGGRTLRQIVHGYVHNHHDVGAHDLRITFVDDNDDTWALTDAAGRFELQPTDRDLLGRVPFNVRRYAGDQLVGEHRVVVNVSVRRSVVVAQRDVQRRQTITSADVKLESRWIEAATADGLGSINDALGMTASRRLRAGQVLDADAIEPRRVVQRGQLITVRAISGGLVIKTVGRSMEDGYQGQLIEVRNDKTREKFHVRVSGPQSGVLLVNPTQPTPAEHQGGQS